MCLTRRIIHQTLSKYHLLLAIVVPARVFVDEQPLRRARSCDLARSRQRFWHAMPSNAPQAISRQAGGWLSIYRRAAPLMQSDKFGWPALTSPRRLAPSSRVCARCRILAIAPYATSMQVEFFNAKTQKTQSARKALRCCHAAVQRRRPLQCPQAVACETTPLSSLQSSTRPRSADSAATEM
jgi:hypothetical protein